MENQSYKTLDIGEAAALLCLGYELEGLSRTTKPKQRAFLFANDFPRQPAWASNDLPKAELAGHDYRNRARGLSVDAYAFFLAYKELKSRVHDEVELGGR